ncbi:hypothetical protein F2Q69_00057523 [Brassica cretica]|uniref:AP2/ERF domain-containing protein n=1 Tax=Brassica cretica TaxID=69181 RepID=A0A8S9MXF2_BRACR|nr:hypothetical protein F2Q69_00057523 [Brassica cretica]
MGKWVAEIRKPRSREHVSGLVPLIQLKKLPMAYQAFILRSHNATLNFPEHFVNKEVELHDETDASSSLDQKQPETLQANKVNLGSNEVAVSDGGVEDGMAEAWLNAVTLGWGS